MREINIDEIKQISVSILNYIDDICKKNNIKYFLAAGTLLGAVRHKGFIPWDDDIDLFMERKDYMKFIDVCKKDQNKNFKCLSLYDEEDNSYYYSFLKVVALNTIVDESYHKDIKDLGVWVDIFPLDSYSERVNFSKFNKYNKFLYLYMIAKYDKTKSTLKNWLKWLVLKIVKTNRLSRKYAWKVERLAQKFNDKSSDKLYIGLSPVGEKDVFLKKWFETTVELEFEGRKYPCPKYYDEILTHRYGDYMQLPPKEQQVTHHFYNAYLKEK